MGHVRFICIVLAICLAGYSALFILGRSSTYCTLTKRSADLSPCYKFSVAGQKADILVVGDSSLLYGIRPDVVESFARRSVYNYGIVGPTFAFDPRATIERYLATNTRPRAIIVYLSPWDIVEPGKILDPVWFPAGLTALQHGGLAEMAAIVRARPSAIVELPPIILSSIGFSTQASAQRRKAMEAAGGHFDFETMLNAGNRSLKDCPASPPPGEVPQASRSRAALASLKAHYAGQGIPLYIYTAPFGRCGAQTQAIAAAYRGIADNVPTSLPDELFARESGYGKSVHVNRDGVLVVSRLLGEFIQTHQIGAAP
jgi:hypothetical protein